MLAVLIKRYGISVLLLSLANAACFIVYQPLSSLECFFFFLNSRRRYRGTLADVQIFSQVHVVKPHAERTPHQAFCRCVFVKVFSVFFWFNLFYFVNVVYLYIEKNSKKLVLRCVIKRNVTDIVFCVISGEVASRPPETNGTEACRAWLLVNFRTASRKYCHFTNIG